MQCCQQCTSCQKMGHHSANSSMVAITFWPWVRADKNISAALVIMATTLTLPFFTTEYFLKYFMNLLQEILAALPGPGYSRGKSSKTHSYQYFHVSKQWYMSCGSTNTATCITSKGQQNPSYLTTRKNGDCKGGWSLARNSFTQIWKEKHQKNELHGGVVFKDRRCFIRSYCGRTFIPKLSKWSYNDSFWI